MLSSQAAAAMVSVRLHLMSLILLALLVFTAAVDNTAFLVVHKKATIQRVKGGERINVGITLYNAGSAWVCSSSSFRAFLFNSLFFVFCFFLFFFPLVCCVFFLFSFFCFSFSFFGLFYLSASLSLCVSVSASGFEGWWNGFFQYGLRCELDRRHMAIISLQPGVWKYFSNMGQTWSVSLSFTTFSHNSCEGIIIF